MAEATLGAPVDFDPFAKGALPVGYDRVAPDVQAQRDKIASNIKARETTGEGLPTDTVVAGVPRATPEQMAELSVATPNRGAKIAAERRKPVFQETAKPAVTVGAPVDYDPFATAAPPDTVATSAVKGLAHGALGLAESVNIGMQFIGNRVGSKGMAEQGESGAQYFNAKAKPLEASADIQGSIADNPALLAKGSWWAYNLADTIPSLAASIVPGVGAAKAITIAGKAIPLTEAVIQRLAIAGGSIAGGAAGGSLEGAQTYQEVLKRGAPEGEAAVAGSMMAMASAALNAISVGKLVSPSKSGALVRFLTTGATEGLTEWAEEPAEGAILSNTSVAKPEDDPAKRAIQGLNVLPIAAVLGGGAGVLHGGSQPATVPPSVATNGANQPAPPAAAPDSPPVAAAPPTSAPTANAAPIEPDGLPLQFPGFPTYTRAPESLATQPIENLPPPLSAIDQARADAQVLKAGNPLDAEGNRLKNATLVAVYGENAAVRHVVEGGQQFSAVGDAMLSAAPMVERVRGTMKAGDNRDITDDILGAVDELAKIKASGQDVAQVLAHGVPHDISYEGQQLLQFLHENADNSHKIADFLERYLHEVEMASGVPSQVRGRAFDIIEERNAARKAESEAQQTEQKDAAFKTEEKKVKSDKLETTKLANEQHRAEIVLQTIARAKASGSGINSEHMTAMELAFAKAQLKKGDNGKPKVGGSIQGGSTGGSQNGARPVQTGSGKGAVSKPAETRDSGNSRPLDQGRNIKGAQGAGSVKSTSASDNPRLTLGSDGESHLDKTAVNGGFGNAETSGNNGDGVASGVSDISGGNVPLEVRPGQSKADAIVAERGLNRVRSHAQLAAYILGSHPGIVKGFGSLDIPSKRKVKATVVRQAHHAKILNAVIKAIPIDVMDDLAGIKGSADGSLYNETMFIRRLSALDINSPILARIIDVVVGRNASLGTKDFLSSGASEGSAAKADTANTTNQSVDSAGRIDSTHGVTPNSSVVTGAESATTETAPPIIPPAKPTATSVALSIKDIPAGLKITLPVLIEESGETVQVEMNARKAFRESQQRVNRLKLLLECLT